MKIHISNTYGIGGIAVKAQNTTAEIAKRNLQWNELGIYRYPIESDSPEMLRTRLDGILSSVSHGDIVVMQFPTWNDTRFDESLFYRLNAYRDIKKIIFLHDVPPLMAKSERPLLSRYIDLYNQADLIITASQNMVDRLCKEGLTVKKIVIQRMWDFPVNIDNTIKPQFNRIINFIGNPNREPKFAFAKEWNFKSVQLSVTVDGGEWSKGKNICFLGWFNNDNLLANALRRSGGFGLLWSEDSVWQEYMKLNACYKFSTYLASGLPVIVHSSIPEMDTVVRKNLGLVVDSLDEAVDRIEHMSGAEYQKMTESVEMFSNLLRDGYFTKKALIDAVFKLLAD